MQTQIDVTAIVRQCRLRVAEQYKLHGDSHALVAAACASIVLEAYIIAGSLVPSALDQICEVLDNLGTTRRCGEDVTECCVRTGAALFEELEAVYAAQDLQRAAELRHPRTASRRPPHYSQ